MAIIRPDQADRVFEEMKRRAEELGVPLADYCKRGAVVMNEGGNGGNGNQPRQKMAQGGFAGGATNISRMAPMIYSPLLQISSQMLPRSIEEKNAWRRWFYQHDPIVGTAIDLHTRYPLSQFRLRCPDDPDGRISAEYEEIAEQIQLFKLFLHIGQEYWVVGEAIPFGIWNEDELTWDAFVLINPDYVDIQVNPFSGRDPVISIVKWSPVLRKIVSGGPDDPRTGYIYRQLAERAQDILYCIENNLPYRLSPMATSHVARKCSYFDIRGTSIIDRLFKILIYQDKLQAAQLAQADRCIVPIEIWKIGNDENPADEEALEQLESVLRATWNSPSKAIIWNHTLSAETLSVGQGILPLPPEFDWIDKQKMAALLVNEAILHGEGPTYANASVAMDVVSSWYQTYRQELEEWARKNVFEPIARARGYWKVSEKELVGRYRDKTVKREPILPEVVWDKASLRDDYQKLQTLISLAQANRVPWKYVYELLNMDYETVQKILKEEAQTFTQIDLERERITQTGMATINKEVNEVSAEGGLGGGMGGMPGSEFGLGGGGMGGAGGGMPPPATGAESPGGLMMPPESVGAPPMPEAG